MKNQADGIVQQKIMNITGYIAVECDVNVNKLNLYDCGLPFVQKSDDYFVGYNGYNSRSRGINIVFKLASGKPDKKVVPISFVAPLQGRLVKTALEKTSLSVLNDTQFIKCVE